MVDDARHSKSYCLSFLEPPFVLHSPEELMVERCQSTLFAFLSQQSAIDGKIIMHHLKIMKIVSFFFGECFFLPMPVTKRQKPTKSHKRFSFSSSLCRIFLSFVFDDKKEVFMGFDSSKKLKLVG